MPVNSAVCDGMPAKRNTPETPHPRPTNHSTLSFAPSASVPPCLPQANKLRHCHTVRVHIKPAREFQNYTRENRRRLSALVSFGLSKPRCSRGSRLVDSDKDRKGEWETARVKGSGNGQSRYWGTLRQLERTDAPAVDTGVMRLVTRALRGAPGTGTQNNLPRSVVTPHGFVCESSSFSRRSTFTGDIL